MLHIGESPEKIALHSGINPATITNYKQTYQSTGLDFYLSDHYKSYQGKLGSANGII